MRAMARRYPLIIFYLFACAFSWTAWMTPDSLFAKPMFVWLPIAGLIILARGPLAASIIVAGLKGGKAEMLTLLRKFTVWRVNWHWYAFALLLAPAIGLTAVYANMVFGAPPPTAMLLATWPSILSAFALRLVNPLDGPMAEELGWRGFALPHLQTRYAPLVAYLVLGIMAIGWHLPLVLRGDFPAFALLGTLAQTIVFSWLYNRTRGSVLLVLIAHAADGLIRPDLGSADQTRFWVLLVIGWCVAALVIIIRHWLQLTSKSDASVGTIPLPQPSSVL